MYIHWQFWGRVSKSHFFPVNWEFVNLCCVLCCRVLFPGGTVSLVSSGYATVGKAMVEMAVKVTDSLSLSLTHKHTQYTHHRPTMQETISQCGAPVLGSNCSRPSSEEKECWVMSVPRTSAYLSTSPLVSLSFSLSCSLRLCPQFCTV